MALAGVKSILLVMGMALCIVSTAAARREWNTAHATFYGDIKGTETMSESLNPFS